MEQIKASNAGWLCILGYLRDNKIKQGFTPYDAHIILPRVIQESAYDAQQAAC
jgi:hypothetical protein